MHLRPGAILAFSLAKEAILSRYEAILAGALAALCGVFGGWTSMLACLLTLQVLDFVSGIASASVRGKASSKIGWKGVWRKLLVWCGIATAHQVALLAGTTVPAATVTATFFAAIEALSIIENLGEAGVPMPDVVVKAVEALRGKSK